MPGGLHLAARCQPVCLSTPAGCFVLLFCFKASFHQNVVTKPQATQYKPSIPPPIPIYQHIGSSAHNHTLSSNLDSVLSKEHSLNSLQSTAAASDSHQRYSPQFSITHPQDCQLHNATIIYPFTFHLKRNAIPASSTCHPTILQSESSLGGHPNNSTLLPSI